MELTAPVALRRGLFLSPFWCRQSPMTVAFSALPCPDSSLRRLDPRWKLAGLVLLTVATACLRQPDSAALALAGALTLAVLGRLPPRWFLARLGVAALFLSPFVASLPLLVHRPDTLSSFG